MPALNTIHIQHCRDSGAWDRFVQTRPDSGYCHLFNWSRVLQETYGHRPFYLAAVKKHGPSKEKALISGILPLFLFDRLNRKPKLVSIPFFDQAGILAEDPEIKSVLFNKSVDLIGKTGCADLEIRQNYQQDFRVVNGTSPLFSDVRTIKVGMSLKLLSGEMKIMQGFKSKLRSQIKKGYKNGLTARIGKLELLDSFYGIYSRNMRDLGSPVHAKAFFHSIFNHFYDQVFICLVSLKDGTPAAAGFLFRFKNKVSNPWASSLRAYRHLNANMVLYWEMIRFACLSEMQRFDMGRSSRNASTYRFKKQWGPEETPLFWYNWFQEERYRGYAPETLTIKNWQRLPLVEANRVGPFLRKHISL